MSDADVQVLLDKVAAELNAGVALGDLDDRLLAYTAHEGPIDEVRQASITRLRLTEERLQWFEQWGIREATRPVRTPAHPSVGALERWCVPVRYRGMHFGYIWVLDAGTLTESDLRPAVQAANEVGALLYLQRLSSQVDSDLLRLLLIPAPDGDGVSADLRALRSHAHDGPIAIIVAGAAKTDQLTPEELRDLALAVERVGKRAQIEGVLSGMIAGLGVLLCPLRARGDFKPALRLGEAVRQCASEMTTRLDVAAAIGGASKVGDAPRSYAEAQRTLRIIRAVPDLGPVTSWDELGVFRPLALLPPFELETGLVDPRVARLLDDPALTETAETFLDRAGNVQETAERLFLHRTTLYQRLDRIAAAYGLDLLRNGDHRLITHLGLKLARLLRG